MTDEQLEQEIREAYKEAQGQDSYSLAGYPIYHDFKLGYLAGQKAALDFARKTLDNAFTKAFEKEEAKP